MAAIGVLGAWLAAKFGQNKKLANIAQATSQVILATQLTVGKLQQTAVQAMKAAMPNGKLTEEQIAAPEKDFMKRSCKNPTAHAKDMGFNPPDNRTAADDYTWNTSTIVHMLSRQEYLGHTVNFKTYRKSYKKKAAQKHPVRMADF